MFIIFGTRGMTTRVRAEEPLQSACPECQSDLSLKSLKRWFTLFFIPIFPFNTVQTFYQCDKCKSSYKQSAKEALLESSKSQEEVAHEAKKLYAKGLTACMVHMAGIDGHIDESEMKEIQDTTSHFTEFQSEIKEVISKVKDAENAEDCKPPMTADGELKARAPRWFIISTAPQARE